MTFAYHLSQGNYVEGSEKVTKETTQRVPWGEVLQDGEGMKTP